jgi:succinylarginine dihydrolase
MRNGGGPACLRQRVVLNNEERSAIKGRIFLDGSLFEDLVGWVANHYRTQLSKDDLSDPSLLRESRAALDDLTRILELGNLYSFQR